MKKLLFLYFICCWQITTAQNVGIGTTTPDPSAALDVHATKQGLLIPTVTTAQRNNIQDPAFGLLVFDKDKGTVMFFDGSNWRALAFTDESNVAPQSHGASDASDYAQMGSHVAISGNYAIAGAPKVSVQGLSNAGAAYIFFKNASGWTQQKEIRDPDAAANDYFGGSVAISGDYAVIASSTKVVGANSSQGKVYVYKRNNTNWVLDTTFAKPGGVAYEYFGWSVGIAQQTNNSVLLTVGIPYSSARASSGGELYCYHRLSGGKWTFMQSVTPLDLGSSDHFGQSISMDGQYMVAGAPTQTNITYNYAYAGAAYVYVFGGGVWTQQQKFSGFTANAQYGSALSISGDRIAIGAPWAIPYTNTSALVSLYKRSGATWTNTSSLYVFNFEIVPGADQISSSATVSGQPVSVVNITFGMSVALYGNNLLVGASGGVLYPNGGASYYPSTVGSVYIYKNFSGDSFSKTQVIKSNTPFAGDLFGESVGLSDGKYIIGNPLATNDSAVNGGDVYFGNLQ